MTTCHGALPATPVLACLTAALSLLLLTACGPSTERDEEAVADFYRGKTITLINGFVVGGPAQASELIFTKHLAKHIPGNPTIMSQSMPGAGTLRAANFVFNAAPKDGTVIGLFSPSALLTHLWKEPGAQFDPRQFGWLGSVTRRPTALALFRTDAPAKTFQEAMQAQSSVGSSGAGAPTSVYARLLNATTGTKFKLVLGYQGQPQILLAMEQGEVHGLLGYSWGSLKQELPHLLENKTFRVLAQLAVVPDPELTQMGVPMALDFVTDESNKRVLRLVFGVEEMSRPYAVPPGVPPQRLAALRKALEDTVNSPEYIAEIKRSLPDPVYLTTGEQIDEFLNEAYSLPQPVIDNAIKLMQEEG
jgi:tripartite-type tricarboxylate transporter receptor subunit TctC